MKEFLSLFVVSDRDADSFIFGQHTKIIKITNWFACILGYDFAAELYDLFTICLGYLMTRDCSGYIVLILVHKVPYHEHSGTTLLLEWQFCEYGNVVNSCSKDHKLSHNPVKYGTQQIVWMDGETVLPFTWWGGTMGLELPL